jgi:hypothetical protein
VTARQSRQVNSRLRVREEFDAYFVVLENDESDWVVKFSKEREFAAELWATNMAESYNDRLDDPRMDAVKRNAAPPGAD